MRYQLFTVKPFALKLKLMGWDNLSPMQRQSVATGHDWLNDPRCEADFAGPLAGFLIGLERCETPYLVTVPCDTPAFPEDLVARLAQALEAEGADLAMARSPHSEHAEGGRVGPQLQPVFCMMRSTLMEDLLRFMQEGGRKIDLWTARQRSAVADFDDASAFFNANTLAELRQLEARGA